MLNQRFGHRNKQRHTGAHCVLTTIGCFGEKPVEIAVAKPEENMCGCVDVKASGLAMRLLQIHNA